MNDNSSLTHPLVLKAAKKCKDCHYTMTSASMRRIYDPHTKERIATSKVVFAHKNKELPLPIHQFIRSEMTKQNAKLRTSIPPQDTGNIISWPQNKPIADIVFTQPIHTYGEIVPALWVMLPQLEILKRLVCNRYNQFLFINLPHPMLLWITVIYNRKHGPKWLPYYLDLKTTVGQEIVKLLGETGYYRLLFFARETPNRCSHIMLSSIAPAQRQRLQQWVASSNMLGSSSDPQISKGLLKAEYEKIKPLILAKLENLDTDSPSDISG